MGVHHVPAAQPTVYVVGFAQDLGDWTVEAVFTERERAEEFVEGLATAAHAKMTGRALGAHLFWDEQKRCGYRPQIREAELHGANS